MDGRWRFNSWKCSFAFLSITFGDTMKNKSNRFAFRFRLQTMLVLVTAFTIVLGLVTQDLHRNYRKKIVAEELRRQGRGGDNFSRRAFSDGRGKWLAANFSR
jgi:hypothetical protein